MVIRSLFLYFFTALCIARPIDSYANDMTPQVQAKAELAVSQFQQRAGGRLDYSEESLGVVEEMLEEAFRYSAQMSKKDTDAIVQLFGSYVIEVARRKYGGSVQWLDQGDQPVLVVGEPTFHVALATFDKVRGRLNGDKSDNIPFFYQGFAERVKAATPGVRTLYI